MDKAVIAQLEKIIDKQGFQRVVEAMAEIAYLKSDHVRETWQDMALSHAWEAIGKRIDGLAAFSKKFKPL